MNNEQFERARQIHTKITDVMIKLKPLRNGCDISIGGSYIKNEEPELTQQMRQIALEFYEERLANLEKEFGEL